jgi:hypothetical protein
MDALFQPSAFVPVALGFFGLATGYFVTGGQALFGYPKPVEGGEGHRTVGLWAMWMSGFMQFLTGISLLIGLTWFQVFTTTPPLYMAALAFTAFGVHWFAHGYQKYIKSDDGSSAWMSITFFFLSLLGIIVFFTAGDAPVGIVFVGLLLVYLAQALSLFGVLPNGPRIVGLFQFLTGIWLIYMTYAVVMNTALGAHWWA